MFADRTQENGSRIPKPPDQHGITVYYEDEVVGEFVADVIVEDAVILELKSVRRVVKAHEVQLVNYLTATRKDVGLIINFGESKVEIKRKVRELPESQFSHHLK